MGLVTGLALGAAAIGAGASAISSNSASKRAAETSQTNTDANVGLAREIYGQNRDALNPFMQRGNAAGNAMNALLGLGGSQTQGGPANVGALPGYGAPNALSQFGGSYAGAGPVQIDGPAAMQDARGFVGAGLPYGIGDNFIRTATVNNGMASNTQVGAQQNPTMPAQGQTAQQAAEGAFDTFRNSTGYQFRLGEGMDGVTSAYAGIGGLQSGAAMRGINEYGQNFASNEFGNYMNALGGQQAVGAASSLAGVGQNFAGTVIGQNNFNAQNQMNAQLGQQNVFGNMLGTIGGGFLGYGR